VTITLNHAIVTAADNDEAHPLGGRGVYFSDAGGNLYELISPRPT
jgi:hypothetical protein